MSERQLVYSPEDRRHLVVMISGTAKLHKWKIMLIKLIIELNYMKRRVTHQQGCFGTSMA